MGQRTEESINSKLEWQNGEIRQEERNRRDCDDAPHRGLRNHKDAGHSEIFLISHRPKIRQLPHCNPAQVPIPLKAQLPPDSVDLGLRRPIHLDHRRPRPFKPLRLPLPRRVNPHLRSVIRQPRRFSIEDMTRWGETHSRLNATSLKRAIGTHSSFVSIGMELRLSKMQCVTPLRLGQVQSLVSTFNHLIRTLFLRAKESRANAHGAAVVL